MVLNAGLLVHALSFVVVFYFLLKLDRFLAVVIFLSLLIAYRFDLFLAVAIVLIPDFPLLWRLL